MVQSLADRSTVSLNPIVPYIKNNLVEVSALLSILANPDGVVFTKTWLDSLVGLRGRSEVMQNIHSVRLDDRHGIFSLS